MIKVDNLTKTYNKKNVVDSLTFHVKEGEVMGFLGPNGAGKTTTMRILTGFLSPTSGSGRIAGYDVFSQSQEVKKRIGYLPEKPPLYYEMRVKSYLNFIADIKGVSKKDKKSRIDFIMEKTGITDVKNQVISTLSKGYRQRVGIAQALVHNPKVIILDEPTSGLDPMQIIEVRDLINSLKGDHTIILSSHILPEVAYSCERVVIINHGKIVAIDTPDNLTKKLLGGEIVRIKTSGGDIKKLYGELKKVQGIVHVEITLEKEKYQITTINCDNSFLVSPYISKIIINNNLSLHSLEKIEYTLEEIFLKLMDSKLLNGVK